MSTMKFRQVEHLRRNQLDLSFDQNYCYYSKIRLVSGTVRKVVFRFACLIIMKQDDPVDHEAFPLNTN